MSLTESTRAFCYLETIHDEKNKLLLTEQQLLVVEKGRTHVFELPHIKSITFGQRKPMLYLIAGGIVVPFTALAYYRDFLAPFPTLILLVGGLFALYWGWLGYEVLTINLFTHHRDFRISTVSPNLRAFVTFTSRHLPANSHVGNQNEKMIYHIIPKSRWKALHKESLFPVPAREKFIHACGYHQIQDTLKKHFHGQKDLLLLTIDPLEVRAQIKYEDLTGSGQVFPHIYGPLNLDAVQKIAEL